MNIFHERIRELRIEKGLSQGDVAKQLGITRSAYANYEQGTREPSLDCLVSICKFFDVTADYLLGLSDSY